MEGDFKECIIRLMQHPIMCKPISELTTGEQEYAYDLLSSLFDYSIEESYTLLDTIQTARLRYALGELSNALGGDPPVILEHYRSALCNLKKGGLDLSLNKWVELVSLRTAD